MCEFCDKIKRESMAGMQTDKVGQVEAEVSSGLYGSWISIKDKLPELGEKVLVVLDGLVILIGRLNTNGWSAFYSDGECLIACEDVASQVTHWMLLPGIPDDIE